MDRYLVLENGMVFAGKAFGADGEVTAEVVFTTSMTGYLETLTDKSYTGQAIVQTFPLIGNYGVIPADFESERVGCSAYIVREHCLEPSNFRREGTLDAFLKARGVVGLYGIDTRALTRILREHGVMNGKICSSPMAIDLDELRNFRVTNPVAQVSTKESYISKSETGKYQIAMLDFGLKENIRRSLVKRGCDVHVLPYNATVAEILAVHPDGIFLTHGPGDPADNVGVIETLKTLMKEKIPMMGICLGHQLLALANGFETHKLKYGHRGAKQPVRDMETGRIFITSQNHGYAVISGSIREEVASEYFTNVNDGTNEGLRYKNAPIFSVQFHPEARGGPRDTDFLFDEFINMLGGARSCR